MVGVQCRGFELILSFLNLQVPVFLADDVELTDHLDMADQVIRVDIEGHDLLATLVPPHALLEVQFALSSPFIVGI